MLTGTEKHTLPSTHIQIHMLTHRETEREKHRISHTHLFVTFSVCLSHREALGRERELKFTFLSLGKVLFSIPES